MHEIGFVLTTVLVTILIIGIAIFRVLKFNYFLSICGAILLALNGSFLNQYYNGGISQAFGLIGNFGLLLILILILSESELLSTKLNRHAIFFISLMAWNASAISYVDATLVVAILLVLLTLSLTLFARKYVLSLSVLMLLPGFCTLIINPIFVYSIVKNLTFRFDANLNTGLKTGNWRLPTQNLGFLPSYTEFAEAQSSLTKFLALTIFVIILIVMFVVTFTNLRLNASFIILMWCSSLVCLIGYLLAQSSKGRSDYLYNKVTTYIAPFFVVSFLYLIKTNEIKFVKPIKSSFIISLTFVVLISSVQVEYAFSKSRAFTTILPNPYGEIMQNKKIKMYLESNNYILPYKAAYNFTGLLGVKYWISKAPNDYNLEIEDRINRPLLLLCFKGDNICEPKTKKINHQLSPELSKYGIVEYESELSTSEYSKLSIRERYAYAFSIMGTEPVEIPERYVGGNPYLK
jgi:hypothetical protein